MRKPALLAASILLGLGLTACTTTNQSPATANLVSGLDLQNIDTSVRYQDDFYRFVNGKWLERTEIPADKSNYGSFTELYDQSKVKLREALDNVSKGGHPKGSDEQKLADLYNSFMDEAKVNALGLDAVKTQLDAIKAIQSHTDVTRMFAEMGRVGVSTPLSWFVNNDSKNSSQYAVYVGQSGLGLPDRDYYFKDDEKSQNNRDAYQIFIADMLKMAGHAKADDAAKRIMELETAMAKHHWTRVERRDPVKSYNKMSAAEFDKLLGPIDWKLYAEHANLAHAPELIVRQPSYFSGLHDVYSSNSIETWQDYLTFKLISSHANRLSDEFRSAQLCFLRQTVAGSNRTVTSLGAWHEHDQPGHR